MAKKIIAFILAGGRGGKLIVLTRKRAKAALPYGGKYRVIDFSLSNCVNSGIFDIGLLTQFRPMSLNQHIGIGKPWDLDRLRGGIRILQPYYRDKYSTWYRGTADAIYQNMDFIEDTMPDNVLILSGDQVYKMDYSELIRFHEERDATLTLAVKEVPLREASRFGIVKLDGERVVSFTEKPKEPAGNLAFMGIYLFKREYLMEMLERNIPEEKFDLVHHIVIPAIEEGERVFAYRFLGYWEDIGTIESYYNANMELVKPLPQFDLYDRKWIIRTKSEEKPPVKVGKNAKILHSIVANGCIVNGEVINSILFPGVYINESAKIVDSIIMNDTYISEYTTIQKAILDKDIYVNNYVSIGEGEYVPNEKDPTLSCGITTIGKGTHIPEGVKIGKNCLIDAFIGDRDFPETKIVPSGKNILRGGE